MNNILKLSLFIAVFELYRKTLSLYVTPLYLFLFLLMKFIFIKILN